MKWNWKPSRVSVSRAMARLAPMAPYIRRGRAWAGRHRKPLLAVGIPLALWGLFVIGAESGLEWYTGIRNGTLTYDSVQQLTPEEYEALANNLVQEARQGDAARRTAKDGSGVVRQERERLLMQTASFREEREKYPHIEYFRRAGIRSYTGPETCLQCHKTMKVRHADGTVSEVDTMADVMDTTHFQFQREASGFSTYGYDGRNVNGKGTRPIPVGKIDRACGIPGSFSWTGWAALVKSKPARLHGGVEMRSEGCGQCHIGGNYHPDTEEMLPGFKPTRATRHGLDCLVCHSDKYDMNYRYVVKDSVGYRWNQDRTMRAAMTVGWPTAKNCLNCHQHNMGGDTYAYNAAAMQLGYKNPRLLHPGAKRANPFSVQHDVHAKAGMNCLDCHTPQGHKIPRGTMGTDLVANDLPGVDVSCQKCHSDAPHTKNPLTRVILNGHTARLACESCHIKKLEPSSVVLRDWVKPTWNKEEGLYIYTDIYQNGQPGRGMQFLWYNGNGTFLANALGDNPTGGPYNPLMNQITRPGDPAMRSAILKSNAAFFKANNLDPNAYLTPALDTLTQLTPEMRARRAQVIERNLRSVMRGKPSKIYPFKVFNARMYEDMANQGPFGAMILPFDYPTYYETGDSYKAMEKAVSNPMVRRMYEAPFKYYMMDEFIRYFGVGSWNTAYPLEKGNRKNIQPHWMRQMGTLMVNHAITREGRDCRDCHSPTGVMDFRALGYSAERTRDLQHLKELQWIDAARKTRTARK